MFGGGAFANGPLPLNESLPNLTTVPLSLMNNLTKPAGKSLAGLSDKSSHGLGDSKSKADGINSGGQRSITINIGKQIEKFEVHTTTLKEGVNEMGAMIREELKRVLYSVNSMEAA